MNLNVNKIMGSILIAGFTIGILYVNLFASEYFRISGIFSYEYIYTFTKNGYMLTDYWLEISCRRLYPIIIILISVRTRFCRWIVMMVLMWYSFLFGSYLSMGILMYSGKGLLLCILSTFPHLLFYLLSYYLVILYAWQRPVARWNLSKSITLALSMLCGVVIECSINPIILKWYIGFM